VEAALGVEQVRLERHELHSPDEADILDVHDELGEVIGAGSAVITLANTAHPYVDVFVPQGKLEGIVVGKAAKVKVDSLAQPLPGKVEHVAQRTEFTPRFLFSERERPNLVVRVRVRVDDPKRRLHAGVPAFVTVTRK
jgi:HlyD family secretion protein